MELTFKDIPGRRRTERVMIGIKRGGGVERDRH